MIENFQLVLNVIVYFLNFSGIICMMFVITVDYSYFAMTTQIIDNWSLGFITDVKLINKTHSEKENVCPERYEYLFYFNWPGTKAGCDCLGVFNMTGYVDFEDKMLIGTCSIMMTKFGCKTIPELPGKKIHSISDFYYCVKRNNFNYFLDYSDSIYYNECPVGYKNCGVIDTLNNRLCVDYNFECPNHNSNLNNHNDNNNLLSKVFYVTDQINIPNENSVYFNYSTIPEIIKNTTHNFLQFRVSQGNICINNNEMDLSSNEIYELFKFRKKIKCSTKLSEQENKFKYDNRYKPILVTDTNQFFYLEDFLKSNIKSLPNFNKDYFDDLVIIYGRNYIGWDKKCKGLINKFKEMHNFAIKLEEFAIYYLVYSLIMLIYCMLFIMIFKELLFDQYSLKILIIVIHIILIIIIFIFVLKDNMEIYRNIDLCFKIIKKRCSDEETNRLIVYVIQVFKNISELFDTCIVLYVIMFFLSLIKILLTIYKVYKRNILSRVMHGDMNQFEMVLLM